MVVGALPCFALPWLLTSPWWLLALVPVPSLFVGYTHVGDFPGSRTSLHLQRPSEAAAAVVVVVVAVVVVVSGTTPCAMWPRVSAPK